VAVEQRRLLVTMTDSAAVCQAEVKGSALTPCEPSNASWLVCESTGTPVLPTWTAWRLIGDHSPGVHRPGSSVRPSLLGACRASLTWVTNGHTVPAGAAMRTCSVDETTKSPHGQERKVSLWLTLHRLPSISPSSAAGPAATSPHRPRPAPE
jgi:hypothetical protein